MPYIHSATRFIRVYILSQEAVVTYFTLVVLYLLIFQRKSVKDFVSGIWPFSMSSSDSETYQLSKYQKVKSISTVGHDEKTKASWELRKSNVGVYAIQGRRQHMEDRFNVVTDLEHTGTSIYGIFDGHGGELAADFVEKTLFKTVMVRLLKSALVDHEEDLGKLLTEEILYVDKQLLAVEKLTNDVSGTTTIMALFRDNKLTVANVGDSRGVLCTHDDKAVPISFDHKPHMLKERKRIKEAGGFISFNGVWRVAGVLATSRALGDYPLKERNLLIAEPDILTFDFSELKPKFLILATDGLWDMFSNEEAVMFVKERLDEPHFGAKSIVLQAYYRGSQDNITVMVVNFENIKTTKATTERRGSSA